MTIGRFDSAIEDWRFPPELVEPGERQRMAQVGRHLHGQARQFVMSEKMIDPQHPVTVRAHREVAATLAPLNPLGWLNRDGVSEQLVGIPDETGRVVWTDEFTTIIATLNDATHDRVDLNQGASAQPPQMVVEDGMLALSYTGLLVESGRAGGVARAMRSLVLATRSPSLQGVWQPNEDVLTRQEWQVVQDVPKLLGSLATIDPRFSPKHCAIVYNKDKGE
jgi:hypothetical protein